MRKIVLLVVVVAILATLPISVGAQDVECSIQKRSQEVNRVEVYVSVTGSEWVTITWPGDGGHVDALNGSLVVINLSYDEGPMQVITGVSSGVSCGKIDITVDEWLQPGDGGEQPGQGGSTAVSSDALATYVFYGELPLHDHIVTALGGLIGGNAWEVSIPGAFVESKGAYLQIANINSAYAPGHAATITAIYPDGSRFAVDFWVNNPEGPMPSDRLSWECRTGDEDPYC